MNAWLSVIASQRSMWVLMAVGLMLAAGFRFRSRHPKGHRRGALVIDGRRMQRKSRRMAGVDDGTRLTLAGVAVPQSDEVKHFKLLGTTGTGKSTAIAELLQGALRRGDRAVIADPDGGYLRRFHHKWRGDVILNPFEPAALKWDPFSEIEHAYDAEQLASGLISSTEDAASREWRGYARTFLAAVLNWCVRADRRDVGELWRLIAIAPSDELRAVVAATPAQPFLESDNARMFGSIRSVAGSALGALQYVHAQRAPVFSIRRWVTQGHGVLFIPYQANQIAALRNMVAAWMRLALFQAMSSAERDQRLWFVVDELDALGTIDGLKDALARLRKFGGRCVLGFQSIAQVSSTYGAGEAQTIVENCGNTLILRCSGSENGGTSQFASRLIGDREVLRRQTSRGRDRDGLFAMGASRRSTSVSEQLTTEPALMAPEIEQLPDLCGYLKVASSRAWLRVSLPPRR